MAAYQIVAGTTRGTQHRDNNQDAYSFGVIGETVVAIVADGCSSGQYSHVGASLFCSMFRSELLQNIQKCMPNKTFHYCLERSARRVCAHMEILTTWNSRSFIIEQYLLFTLVGVAIAHGKTYFFNLGDGVMYWNGEPLDCHTGAQHNKPPYLAYRITDVTTDLNLDFHITELDATELESVLIGSDGVVDLVELEGRYYPGTEKKIRGINQFWKDARFFKNPDNVRRELFQINRERHQAVLNIAGKPVLQRYPGLLPDDTTLIVIRCKGISDD